MHGVILLVLLAYLRHAHADGQKWNRIHNPQESHSLADESFNLVYDSRDNFLVKLVGKSFEKASKTSRFHHADLDSTTLGKSGFLAIAPRKILVSRARFGKSG